VTTTDTVWVAVTTSEHAPHEMCFVAGGVKRGVWLANLAGVKAEAELSRIGELETTGMKEARFYELDADVAREFMARIKATPAEATPD